jgi:penicillin-binding protein 1B
VVNASGTPLEHNAAHPRQALDPRIAYLVTSVLEDVIDHGTGAIVRAHGFTAPAAGKTGTSRDGWFAGFTSNLLCIVWVGFDDNRDLGLSGTNSAAPIWAEFMKRAIRLPAYRDVQPFAVPEGVERVTIDPETLQLATPYCPVTREEVYIHGTEPTDYCSVHGGRIADDAPPGSWLSRIFGGGKPAPPEPENPADAPGTNPSASPTPPAPGTDASATSQSQEDENRKGLFHRIFGIFGGTKKGADKPKPGPENPNP